MDRIDFSRNFDNTQNAASFLDARVLGDSKKAKDKKNQSVRFSDVMERSILDLGELGPIRDFEPSEEILEELLDNVRSAGDDLKKKPLANEIINYKHAVRNFLNYVVKNGYELDMLKGNKKKVILGGEAEWKETIYLQIKVVDQKLNRLAEEILTKHISELELKSKVDEVTGLLVDFTITGKIRERND